jgi:hypothetical protein
MPGHDGPANGEPQSGTCVPCGVEPFKGLENGLHVVSFHSRAIIAHDDQPFIRVLVCRDANSGCGGPSMVESISNQILKQLDQPIGNSSHCWKAFIRHFRAMLAQQLIHSGEGGAQHHVEPNSLERLFIGLESKGVSGQTIYQQVDPASAVHDEAEAFFQFGRGACREFLKQ